MTRKNACGKYAYGTKTAAQMAQPEQYPYYLKACGRWHNTTSQFERIFKKGKGGKATTIVRPRRK